MLSRPHLEEQNDLHMYTMLMRKKRSEIEESCEVLRSLLESCDKQADTIGEHAEELKGQVDEYLHKVQAEIFDSSRKILLDLVTGMTESQKKLLTEHKQTAKEYEERLRKAKAFLENPPNEKNATFYRSCSMTQHVQLIKQRRFNHCQKHCK